MEGVTERTVFNQAQLYILEVMSRVNDMEELNDIKNLLAKHFAEKALDSIDALWDEGEINQDTIESWKHEHMRTPYPQN